MRKLSAFLLLLAGCGSNGGLNGGVCDPSCATGFHCVDGTCVTDGTGSDGGSDASIPGCNPACGGATPVCNDQHHCVGCTSDDQCPMGSYCKVASETQATCVRGCMTAGHCGNNQMCCSMQCSDTTNDPRNCGGCGMGCTVPHAAASCAGSKCQTGACDPGWADCNNDPKDGCEANLALDTMNCTACGMACMLPHANNACSNGCYIAACDFGWDDCNQNMDDGCETSVLADANNCGSCGNKCAAAPNATASCLAGNCILDKCLNGFTDCDMKPQNGCETNTGTDINNCGQCGNVCANGLVCKNGSCTCQACNFPNAMSSCVNNMCMMGACNAGFADCNKLPNDGCEVSTDTDPKNCGSCGNVCPMNLPGCMNGQCIVAVNIDTHNLKGHTEYPLDPDKCMCCNNGVTTKQTADALCKLAGYTVSTAYVSAMVNGNNCYCWNCTIANQFADNCCGGQASRPEITQVTCQ
jgi:hypothetical protein